MSMEKLNDFITQILNSGAIKNLAPHEKEESVVAFLNQNEAKLKPMLCTPDFLPNADWTAVKKEISKRVGVMMTELVRPQLKTLISDSLRLDWKGKYSDFMISDEEFREKLADITAKLVSRHSSRKHYSNILSFMNHNVLNTFIMTVYDNKRYVVNGLVRFDDISLDNPEDALGFIYTGLLFLPLFDITLPIKIVMPQYSGSEAKTVSFREVENNAVLRQNYLGKIKEIILKEFPNISPYFLKIIMKTFYNVEEADTVPFASKMLKIVYNFAIQWRRIKKDRGAESFEASWLNVARINYKFYSYDLGTLDEFYKITIEEDI